jgi:HSP20 family protein
MSMIRWDPARDMMSLRQAMDKLFEESVVRPSSFTFEFGGGNIPVDIVQTDREITVKATLPGVKPEEVDISITGDILTIRAERKEEKELKGEGLHSERKSLWHDYPFNHPPRRSQFGSSRGSF